jgi:hypothetical protein
MSLHSVLIFQDGDALIQQFLKDYYTAVGSLEVAGGPGSDEWQTAAFDVLQGIKSKFQDQVMSKPFLKDLLGSLGDGSFVEGAVVGMEVN